MRHHLLASVFVLSSCGSSDEPRFAVRCNGESTVSEKGTVESRKTESATYAIDVERKTVRKISEDAARTEPYCNSRGSCVVRISSSQVEVDNDELDTSHGGRLHIKRRLRLNTETGALHTSQNINARYRSGETSSSAVVAYMSCARTPLPLIEARGNRPD